MFMDNNDNGIVSGESLDEYRVNSLLRNITKQLASS